MKFGAPSIWDKILYATSLIWTPSITSDSVHSVLWMSEWAWSASKITIVCLHFWVKVKSLVQEPKHPNTIGHHRKPPSNCRFYCSLRGIVVDIFSVVEWVTVFDCWLKCIVYRTPINQVKQQASVWHYFGQAALQFERGYWFPIVLTCRFS